MYNLLSVKYNSRIRVKVAVDELTPIDSVTIYNSAGWYEREVRLYGVFFQITQTYVVFSDYGFDGHPLNVISL